jgi:hypothetical protein
MSDNDTLKSSCSAVCPESTIQSANRRDFIRKAAVAGTAVAVGGSLMGKALLPESSASSAANVCGTDVIAACCVVVNNANTNGGLLCHLYPGLRFGHSSGEGIASPRTCTIYNKFGLNFYTGYQIRMSITNKGIVGIGDCIPCCAGALLYVTQPICSNKNAIEGDAYVGGVGVVGRGCAGVKGYGEVGVIGCGAVGIAGVGGNVGVEGTVSSTCPFQVPGFFANTRNTPSGDGDTTARVTVQNGTLCSPCCHSVTGSWNVAVAGVCNNLGIAGGSFYLEEIGEGSKMVIGPNGFVGIGTASPLGQFEVASSGPGAVPIIAKGTTTQSANLQQWQKGCNVESIVNKCGWLALGTAVAPTTLHVNGSFSARQISVSSAYTMDPAGKPPDFAVFASATSAAFTVTLAAASSADGRIVMIKKMDSTANAVTVAAASGDVIEGKTSKVLSKQYDSLLLISNGVHEWVLVGNSIGDAFTS